MYAGSSISRTTNPGFRNQTDSDLDELALFPSEQATVTADDETEQLPWRAPERATPTFVFERHRVPWRQPVPRRSLKSLQLDAAPHRLLNGFVVAVAVGVTVFMGVRGVRAVAEIYPQGGLPRPSAPALLAPSGRLIPSPASVAPVASVAPNVAAPLGQPPAGSSLQVGQAGAARAPVVAKEARPAATAQPGANTAAELTRIRKEATERAAREAEALTASFAGSAGSATGLTTRSDP